MLGVSQGEGVLLGAKGVARSTLGSHELHQVARPQAELRRVMR